MVFMKTKVIISLLFLSAIAIIPLKSIAQTSIIVQTKTSDQEFSITERGKLYFETNSLVINEEGVVTTFIDLANIKKIIFKSENGASIAEEQTEADRDLLIYPNPVEDYLYLSNVNTDIINLQMFSFDGKLVLRKTIQSLDPIDISFLSSGIYFLIVNDKTAKIIKR